MSGTIGFSMPGCGTPDSFPEPVSNPWPILDRGVRWCGGGRKRTGLFRGHRLPGGAWLGRYGPPDRTSVQDEFREH